MKLAGWTPSTLVEPRDDRAGHAILPILRNPDEDPAVRSTAAMSLGRLGDRAGHGHLLQLAHDGAQDVMLRGSAIRAPGHERMRPFESTGALVELLPRETDQEMALELVITLAAIADDTKSTLNETAISHRDAVVRAAARDAARRLMTP